MHLPFINHINSTITPYAIEIDTWYEVEHFPKNFVNCRLNLYDPLDRKRVLMLRGRAVKTEYPLKHNGHVITELSDRYRPLMTMVCIRHTSLALVIEDFISFNFQNQVHVIGVFKNKDYKHGLKPRVGTQMARTTGVARGVYVVDLDE